MKLSTIRAVDFWAGIPLALLADVPAFFYSLLFPKTRDIKNVLMIELSEAGSLIIGYSAMKRLKEAAPDANVYFLIFKRHADGLRMLNLLDEDKILTVRDDSFGNFLRDVWEAIKRIWSVRIDTVIDMELFSRASALLTILTLARNRVGFYAYTNEGLYRGKFMHNYKVGYNPYKHMSLNFMALVESVLNNETNSPLLKRRLSERSVTPFRPEPAKDALKNATKLMKKAFPDYDAQSHKVTIVNPNAGELPIRSWELEDFTQTAKRILDDDEKNLVALIGLESAASDGKYMEKEVKNPRLVNLIGKTETLQDVVDLCRLAKVFLTNDSGPAQYASITGTQVVTLFGPETPALYGPLGNNVHCLYSGFSCSPCLTAFNHRNSKCKDNLCLKAITVDKVTNLCLKLLKE
ncbi:MAG: glycosyltransferase family 9 protein [Nitrospinota bacterium]